METVKDLFEVMKNNRERPAIILNGETVTYQQLIERSIQLANGLSTVLKPGDKMAVWLPNSVDWVVTELAAGLMGVTVVALNLRYKLHELSYILSHSKSKMFIFQPELGSYQYTTTVEQLLNDKNQFPHLEYVVSTGEIPKDCNFETKYFSTFFHDVREAEESFPKECSPTTTMLNMLYTSGTTSHPKGVMLSQKTIIKHSYNAANYLGIHSDDVVLGALPFCGIFGLNTLFASLTSGACIVAMDRYKPLAALQTIDKYQCTVFIGVDGMLTPIFDEKDVQFNLSSMRIGVVAIFTMNNQLFFEKAAAIFPNMRLVQPYGMTEVCSLVVLGNPDASIEERSVSGGFKVSDEIAITIVDQDTGMPLKNGEEGEIVVGGYNVMLGYYDDPEKTNEAFTQDGQFKTGDLGRKLDDGSIIYISRLKEALRLNGFLVSPKEIEDYICSMPEVDIAQIVHVPIGKREQLVACIKLKEGRSLAEKEVNDYCKMGLADFKCPQTILFLTEFPVTAGSNGEKIQKTKLREIAIDRLTQIDYVR